MRKKKLDSETEKKILDSAIKVFHRKGIHRARMQEIADEAGVSTLAPRSHYSPSS